jgi:hypothetical protein
LQTANDEMRREINELVKNLASSRSTGKTEYTKRRTAELRLEAAVTRMRAFEGHATSLLKQMNAAGIKPKLRVTLLPELVLKRVRNVTRKEAA